MSKEKIDGYLQRLTGAPADAASGVRLTSAQKAAFAAWMRRESIEFSGAVLQRPAFSVTALLGEKTANEMGARPVVRAVSAPSRGGRTSLSRLRVGIDLEHVGVLPEASDYREHEFYRENFTPAEIAYCLLQQNARSSLCGLWAAKEAVSKARGEVPADGLRAIEIRHDENGRPCCDGGELSISHSGEFCVALFIALP